MLKPVQQLEIFKKLVHQIDIVECPLCHCKMHKSVLAFHQTRCIG